MKPLGSVLGLVAAIREEGAAGVERIERERDAEVEKLDRKVPFSAEPPERDPRATAATRQVAEARSRADWDDAAALLAAREQFFAEVAAEGWRRIAEEGPVARRDALFQLAREGIERLAGDGFVVDVDPRDAPLFDAGMCEALAAATKRKEIRSAASPGLGAGCIVRATGGQSWFDNRLEERAIRFETAWRGAVGRRFWP